MGDPTALTGGATYCRPFGPGQGHMFTMMYLSQHIRDSLVLSAQGCLRLDCVLEASSRDEGGSKLPHSKSPLLGTGGLPRSDLNWMTTRYHSYVCLLWTALLQPCGARGRCAV